VLHWTDDLKEASAMTDPKDTDTTKTPDDDELPGEALEDVIGGAPSYQPADLD
jgi:hypothetical protein